MSKIVLEMDLIPGKIYRLLTKFKIIGFGVDDLGRRTLKTTALWDGPREIEESPLCWGDKWYYYFEDQGFKFGR